MTMIEKARNAFGENSAITTAIETLVEMNKNELAQCLFEECEELVHPHWCVDDDDDYEPDVDECGFDPYEGCYTYDC